MRLSEQPLIRHLSWQPFPSLRHWPIQAQLRALVLATLLPLALLIVSDVIGSAHQALDAARHDTRHLIDAAIKDIEYTLLDTERSMSALAKRPKVRAMGGEDCDPIFSDPGLLFPDFHRLTLHDLGGRAVCGYREDANATSAWFRDGLRSAGIVIGDARFDQASQRWYVMPTLPVRDPEGRVIGLLAMRLELHGLQERVFPHRLPSHFVLAVFDRQGRFLVRQPNANYWLGRNAPDVDAIQRMGYRPDGGFERVIDADGITRLRSYQALPSNGWVVIAGINETAALAPYESRLALGIALGIAMLWLALALAERIGRLIAGPVHELERVAIAVANGNASARATESGPSELMVVARELNRMLDLRASQQKALTDSELRCAGIIDAAMDGIVALDSQWRIVLFNNAAERMFGHESGAVTGKPFQCLLDSDQTPLLRAFDLSGESHRRLGTPGDLNGLRADGEVFPLEASITRLKGAGHTAYAVTLRDIGDRRRAEEALYRHLQLLESLQDLAQAILAAHLPQQVAQIGLQRLRSLVPFWEGSVTVFDIEAEEASIQARECPPGAPCPAGKRLSFDSYGPDDIERLKAGRLCRVADLDTLAHRPPLLEQWRRQGVRSYLRLPILAEGQLLGALNLASNQLGAFTQHQLGIAQAYSGQMAIALQQALLRQRIERLNHVYAVLSGINALIVRCRTRDELFEGTCRIAVEAGAFKLAWTGIIDPETGAGRVVACYGAGDTEAYAAKIRYTALEDGPYSDRPASRAVRSGQPVVCNDLWTDPSLAPLREDLHQRGINAVACLPLRLNENQQAVITLFAAQNAFDHEEMRLLSELADDIGFALDHIATTEKLDYLAYHDPVTNLANRTLFHERVAPLAAPGREGHRFVLAIADLERFKPINDSFGRATGDALLREIADRLTRHIDNPTLLARIGPDQFALVLSDIRTEEEAARRIEQLLHDSLGPPISIADTELRLSAKCGIALFPDDGTHSEALLENAEAALKKAKGSGEKYLFYRQEMTERTVAALAMESKLRLALERSEFVLHYQPKIDSATGQLIGVEALIRWNSPELGLVPPIQFIPLLEETGLILEVGTWALEAAVAEHRRWCEEGLPAPRIAVNVSPVQLRQGDFVATLQRALRQGTEAPGIELEITETLAMEDIAGNIDKLSEIRDLGLIVAIDDFGTGYSSLAYLAKLPVQALKIDRSFVIAMLEQADAMTLVAAIISLAHSLRLQVIAEGVETEEQAQALRGLACNVMQGYLFSKPRSAESMRQVLLDKKNGGTLPWDSQQQISNH